MRRHSSILMLYARSSLHWVGLLILILALMQGILFWNALDFTWKNDVNYRDSVEILWTSSRGSIAFGVAFVLLTALLISVGWERKEKVSYTLKRLSVSGEAVFLWNAVYNTLCFFLLWAAEIFVVLALCSWYMAKVGPEGSHQTIFLAFYRMKFFHDLMPLEDTACWIRNGVLCLSLGTSSAGSTYVQRRDGRMGGAVIPVVGVAFLAFLQEESIFANYLLIIMCCVFLLGVVFNSVFLKEEGDK